MGIEPGAALVRIARERFRDNPHVIIIQDTFESWPLEREAFDLVAVAQAFHWLSPEVRFIKAVYPWTQRYEVDPSVDLLRTLRSPAAA